MAENSSVYKRSEVRQRDCPTPNECRERLQQWVYLVSDRVRRKIKLVELILHPDHIYALPDRSQRVLRILPNAIAFHSAQSPKPNSSNTKILAARTKQIQSHGSVLPHTELLNSVRALPAGRRLGLEQFKSLWPKRNWLQLSLQLDTPSPFFARSSNCALHAVVLLTC